MAALRGRWVVVAIVGSVSVGRSLASVGCESASSCC